MTVPLILFCSLSLCIICTAKKNHKANTIKPNKRTTFNANNSDSPIYVISTQDELNETLSSESVNANTGIDVDTLRIDTVPSDFNENSPVSYEEALRDGTPTIKSSAQDVLPSYKEALKKN